MNVIATLPSWCLTVKHIHVTQALLSLGGFLFRDVLMVGESSTLFHPLVHRLPHINDTLPLTLGVMLWLAHYIPL